jgi:hypothetical protein
MASLQAISFCGHGDRWNLYPVTVQTCPAGMCRQGILLMVIHAFIKKHADRILSAPSDFHHYT